MKTLELIARNEARIAHTKAVLDFCESQEPMLYCHRCRKEPCECGLMASKPLKKFSRKR